VNFVASVSFTIQVSTCIHWHILGRRVTNVRCVGWHSCQAHILSVIPVFTQENALISARHVEKDLLNVTTWLLTIASMIHWEPMLGKVALRKFTGTLFTSELY
jgi:TRAP-type mannitol/chloroaromatic compound transport system permease small subunit